MSGKGKLWFFHEHSSGLPRQHRPSPRAQPHAVGAQRCLGNGRKNRRMEECISIHVSGTTQKVTEFVSSRSCFRFLCAHAHRGVGGSYSSCISDIVMHLHTVSHDAGQCASVQSFSIPARGSFLIFGSFSDFWVVANLMGVKWYLTVVLIYIFLMISDDEHLLICLLAICL